jgi:excisionase family DNA binding protein
MVKISTEPSARRLNIEEALKYLGDKGIQIKKRTMYGLTSSRKIPHSKFGKAVLFTAADLDIYIEENLREVASLHP